MRKQIRNLLGFVLFGLVVAGAIAAAYLLRTGGHAAASGPAEMGDAEARALPGVAAESDYGERAIEADDAP